jgi:hypothetical protein
MAIIVLSLWEALGSFDARVVESREVFAAKLQRNRDKAYRKVATVRAEHYRFADLRAQDTAPRDGSEVVYMAGPDGITAIGPEATRYLRMFEAYRDSKAA